MQLSKNRKTLKCY